MDTILFVGSNPSNTSTCDMAFHGSTRSSQILSVWCKDVTGIKMHINVANKKTENNRSLKGNEIRANLERLSEDLKTISAAKVIALGKTAAKALTLLGVDFYEMPHPSGRNRKLNDPKYVEEKIKGLISYVNGSNTELPTS